MLFSVLLLLTAVSTAAQSSTECKADTDCPCSYCQNDPTKHAPYFVSIFRINGPRLNVFPNFLTLTIFRPLLFFQCHGPPVGNGTCCANTDCPKGSYCKSDFDRINPPFPFIFNNVVNVFKDSFF